MIHHHGNLTFTPEMEEAILAGRKTKTTRRTPREEGTTFVVRGRHFRIMRVWPQKLATVIAFYYAAEGFPSAEAFELFWKRIRGGAFDGDQIVFVHTFREVFPDEI